MMRRSPFPLAQAVGQRRGGLRVVVINTDLSRSIGNPNGWPMNAFSFPAGPLRQNVVDRVAALVQSQFGPRQGLFITGQQVFLHDRSIPRDSSRFRKVDRLKGHVPRQRRRRQPVAPVPPFLLRLPRFE